MDVESHQQVSVVIQYRLCDRLSGDAFILRKDSKIDTVYNLVKQSGCSRCLIVRRLRRFIDFSLIFILLPSQVAYKMLVSRILYCHANIPFNTVLCLPFSLKKTAHLEEMLSNSVSSLEDTKSYVNQLQAQTAMEKKERAR